MGKKRGTPDASFGGLGLSFDHEINGFVDIDGGFSPRSKSGLTDAQYSQRTAPQPLKTRLNGNVARRAATGKNFYIWDTEIPGFGLRFRANGTKRWITRFFERGKARTVTLGAVAEMTAKDARRAAQQRLKQLALIGLPKKPAHNQSKAQTTMFAKLVETFLEDRPFAWKPGTERRYIACIRSAILPQFGEHCVEALRREDVMRWRDTRIGKTKCFNIEIAVLSALLEYAEKLGIRKIDTNPARGIPRLKETIRERFLTLAEYRRLFQRLNECDDQLRANSIRLLLHTGARHMEIGGLRWGHVSRGRLEIPDSKTGPKIILLSRQAQAILASLPRGDDQDLVFSPNGRTPAYLGKFWMNFRSKAGLPDVRLHDLRHSYASIAVQHGINLAHVGRLLGHALPETTQRYAHLNDQCVQDAAEAVGATVVELLGLSDAA